MVKTLHGTSDVLQAANEAEIARLAAADTRSWWIRGRRAIVAAAIGKHVSNSIRGMIGDLGCGAGAMWDVLKDYGPVIGIDRSPLSIQLCRAKGYATLILGTVEQLPLAAGSLHLAGITDVLEHVEDDGRAIRECARVLKPGGILIVTVPALPFLCSEHDRALGHFRRYSPRGLTQLLRGSGFGVERITYFNTLLLPAVVLMRLLRELLPRTAPRADPLDLPGALNGLAHGVLALERLLLRFVDFPLGVSLLCVARNQGT